MTFTAFAFFVRLSVDGGPLSSSTIREQLLLADEVAPPPKKDATLAAIAKSKAGDESQVNITDRSLGFKDSNGFYFVRPKPGERNFFEIGQRTGTDKVDAPRRLPPCLQHNASCTRPGCVRPECRPWGHHYDTLYQTRLGPYSRDDVEPFQFLEVGFYNGAVRPPCFVLFLFFSNPKSKSQISFTFSRQGYDTYRDFLPQGECHSIEIACLEAGPRNEGKWPFGNFAAKNSRYQQYLDERRLHCGDANDVAYLHSVWTKEMKRPDAPPLRIVVDDGAHLSEHMAQTVFFWLPRIEPRGILIVEDIQPIQEANAFRTQFLPQIMKDLHFCGDPKEHLDELCYPTLFSLLASVHCEMHICVFERSDTPASEPSIEDSRMPKGALDLRNCKSMMSGHW